MTHRVTLTQTQLTADHDRLMAATPATQVAQLTQTTHDLQARLNRGAQQTLLNHQQHLGQLAQSLDFLSPLKVMGRGYSYVTSDDKVLASTADLAVNETVTMHFKDGQATAEIKTIKTTDKD